jgi:hypothetical protein
MLIVVIPMPLTIPQEGLHISREVTTQEAIQAVTIQEITPIIEATDLLIQAEAAPTTPTIGPITLPPLLEPTMVETTMEAVKEEVGMAAVSEEQSIQEDRGGGNTQALRKEVTLLLLLAMEEILRTWPATLLPTISKTTT